MTKAASRLSRRTLLACATSLLVAGAFLGIWAVTQVREDRPDGQPNSEPSGEAPAVVGPLDREITKKRPRTPVSRPAQLAIPAIGVHTSLDTLGLMPDRTVEVPEDAQLAGWFRRGPAPGQRGSSVILGHVDSVDGPAVFARLQELRPGDSVLVGAADGTVSRFVVKRSVSYPNADFPARKVYAGQGGRRLNLVTCTGVYDESRGGYQSNLVVYTQRAARST